MEQLHSISYYYPHGNLLIQILEIPQIDEYQILVFWNDTLIEFKEVEIIDAIHIDEGIVELEILHNSGTVSYYYFEPKSKTCLNVEPNNSKIVSIRTENAINRLRERQKQLWDDDNLELVFTTNQNE